MARLRTWLKKNLKHIIGPIAVIMTIGALLYTWVFSSFEMLEKLSVTTAISTAVVALATSVYAWLTRQQVDASVEIAKEMGEQRIMASRPIIIQNPVNKDKFSHFEIYNAGNGTAIEVQVMLLDQSEQSLDGQRKVFLRAGDTPMEFSPTIPSDVAKSTFYIVSEYQGIPSHSPQPIWYQTWLSCVLSVGGKVISGKLEFRDDVSKQNRIGIFRGDFIERSALE